MKDKLTDILEELRCRHEPEDCKDCRSSMKYICKVEISHARKLIVEENKRQILEIVKLLETYEPQEFKTIGIIGNCYESETWHIKDHMKRLAQEIRKKIEEEVRG